MTVASFSGRCAVVTGGGRGLGRAYALELARRGAAVVVTSREAAPGAVASAEVVAEEIRAAGGRAVAFTGSVADRAAADGVMACALDRFGRLDILVNNAGQTHRADLADIDEADVYAQLASHVAGALLVSQRAFVAMRAAGYGRIVMTGSHAAAFGRTGAAAYAAAMGGVVGLANALAIEGAADGIMVNTVLPVAATRRTEESWAMRASPEAIAAEPFAHRMTPTFVVPLVLHLASAACPGTKGIYSAVGGRYMRVFTGVTTGWLSPGDAPPEPETLAAHWDDVTRTGSHRIPTTTLEDFEQIAALNRRTPIVYTKLAD